MSDYDEFKKVINGFEKSIEYECSDPDLINSIFRDIREMVRSMIQKRDKELESKSSPKVSHGSVEKPEKVCPPGKILNPKTGRCINKPKEKTHKKPGRPKKFDKPEEPKEKSEKECPPGKIVNPKTGRCINKPKEKTHKKPGRPDKTFASPAKPMSSPKQEKSKTPTVSKYHQKQYEKFMKTTEKDDLKEAFVEKVEPKPKLPPRRNPPRGLFSTTVSGPRTRKKPQLFTAEESKTPPSQRKVESIKLANGKTINLDLGL
jgi:hypothetical protein